MAYKYITQKMDIKKFREYCKEFFSRINPDGEISFKTWVKLLGNVEWELNIGLEKPLFEITKEDK